MSLNANKVPMTGKRLTPPLEPGTYPARLVQVMTLGLQKQREYKGETKPPKYEMILGYELLDEFLKDEDGNDLLDKPRWLSRRMTSNNLKSTKATSTEHYLALDPEQKADGEWGDLLGTPCMLTVVVEKYSKDGQDRYKEKITAVSAMRAKEASKAPPLVNEPRVFDFDEPDVEVFKELPDWIQDVMKDALDYPGSALEKALGGEEGGGKVPTPTKTKKSLSEELDDEIPFDEPTEKDEDW